ncbi:inosine/xanthosine triphosphatase [Agarivorans sp. Toyoura001]|uniref:inosine/xanthosine triphosphatase n=1 Tax=unclassified Agarivorans TaxID=2636026 RepID=UPI0010D70EF9|nr:inosine/xanthosine triphosphatase [Agarivorans sp. Toyoura001]GDY24891.1 non-canonical purine NTP phosphatase [Agarivorans sp. Toyoura001]
MSQRSLKVIVGSRNPVKVRAVAKALALYYPDAEIDCQGIDAPSLVPEQPMTTQQTRDGAVNRLRYCQQQQHADIYAAIEGGVDMFEDGPATFAFVAIANSQQTAVGRGANMPLPASVYQALEQGEELGPLMDKLFNTHNIKQKGGAIGLLTNGLATREDNYVHALTLALVKFAHADLFAR